MKMKICYEKAPEKGLLLAYFRNGVVFEFYSMVDGCLYAEKYNMYKEEDLLELHMFDSEREFRAVYSRRKGYIPNAIIPVKKDKQYIMDEVVLLRKSVYSERAQRLPEKLAVRNYLGYDEYGMVTVENFQLMMQEESANV